MAIFLGIGLWLYHYEGIEEIPTIKISYWGPGQPTVDDRTIRPFKVDISPNIILDLKKKLETYRPLVPALEGVAFDYGMNTAYLNKFVDFWKMEYNWTERQIKFNQFPQFMTEIGGLDLHFIHFKPDPSKSKGKTIVPLLVLHGWPGSPFEFTKLIPMLTTPGENTNFVFEIIAPSLPGFAFSEGASKKGLGALQMATILNELMDRLGHKNYFVQGGDWGSVIGYAMSIMFKERILGYHSNFCLATTMKAKMYTLFSLLFPNWIVEEKWRDQYRWKFLDTFIKESGYFHIQATKPDTIGVAFTDSPIGLGSYLLEKYSTWTNPSYRDLPDGGLENFDKLDLLDYIMINWVNRCITTSMRIYKETYSGNFQIYDIYKLNVKVPTACARFPNELIYYPDMVLKAAYPNLVLVSDFLVGGHFASWEQSTLLAEDIWKFVKIVRSKLA